MFFITRLTENTNLAVCIPPAEHIFNAARINIAMARPRFAELDVASRKGMKQLSDATGGPMEQVEGQGPSGLQGESGEGLEEAEGGEIYGR